jgi:hypothetical protein
MSRRLRQSFDVEYTVEHSLSDASSRSPGGRRTIARSIEVGTGPAVIQISTRRVGVTEPDYEVWFKSLRRKAKVAKAA